MRQEEIKGTIIQEILMIAPDIEEGDIKADENIQRSLEIDSFDFLNLLRALNEKFQVEVPEADYAKVDTLDHMAEYFAQRL
jgi:acyl carrier protein